MLFAIVMSACCAAPADYRDELSHRAREESWVGGPETLVLNRSILAKAAEAARGYLLTQQLPAGNFIYRVDVEAGPVEGEDSQVRQAGTLWSLAMVYRHRPTESTRRAVLVGLDFFFQLSERGPKETLAPLYPGEEEMRTGTVALVTLAMTEFLVATSDTLTANDRKGLNAWISRYVDFLKVMELQDGSWGGFCAPGTRRRDASSTPYSDGEAFLAYCKVARYAGRRDLIPRIEQVAPKLVRRYTIDAWEKVRDSDETKAFSQWGCLAFAEYVEAGWKDADMMADAAYALSWWLIHAHQIERRTKNTAYALEALLATYRIARHRGDKDTMARLRTVIERMLAKLTTWQVGGPFADHNPYLVARRMRPDVSGGVLGAEDGTVVRIDTVQHQLHAWLMALEMLYPDK